MHCPNIHEPFAAAESIFVPSSEHKLFTFAVVLLLQSWAGHSVPPPTVSATL